MTYCRLGFDGDYVRHRDGNAKPDSIQMGFLGKQKRHFGQFVCSTSEASLVLFDDFVGWIFSGIKWQFHSAVRKMWMFSFSMICGWLPTHGMKVNPNGECCKSLSLSQIVDLRTATGGKWFFSMQKRSPFVSVASCKVKVNNLLRALYCNKNVLSYWWSLAS